MPMPNTRPLRVRRREARAALGQGVVPLVTPSQTRAELGIGRH